jgi:hypothetical protein
MACRRNVARGPLLCQQWVSLVHQAVVRPPRYKKALEFGSYYLGYRTLLLDPGREVMESTLNEGQDRNLC